MIPSRFLAACVAGVIAAGVYACADRVTGVDTVPAAIDIVSGQGQSGTVAEELSQPIVVRVLNAGGQPLGGQLVNFRVIQGGGSVFAGSSLSNADGLAQERWTLGKSVADSQIVEARVVDASTGAALVSGRFLATALAGTPITLQRFNNPQTTVAGTQLPDSLLVLVSDAYGNPISGATVKWTVESGGGSVNNASALTTATGYASTKWTLGPDAGTQTLLAAVGTTLSTEFSATALVAGSVRMTKVSGDLQTAAPGAAVSVLPTVQLIDPNGGNPHPLGGVAVTFAVTRGGGAITDGNAVTNASGIATVGSWVLGSQSGPNELTASISVGLSVKFTATGVQTSPDISVSFVDPVGPFVGDTAPILVRIDSRFPLSTVRAALDGKVVTLTSPRQYYWSGSISLVGAPRDTMTIVVTATDANGSVGQGVRALIHDRAPRVIVTQPADTSVARPNTLIDASCEDDDPNGCTITVRMTQEPGGDGGLLLAGPTSSPMHTSISLAPWEGQGRVIAIIAQDSRDQATTATRFLWVESSPHLQSIGTAEGHVVDADNSRLLWNAGPNVGITHVGGSSETIASGLPSGFQGSIARAYLTPSGAAFAVASGGPPYAQLYVWLNGSLTSKTLNSTSSVAAAGDFIIYTTSPDGLYRQDVSNGAEVLISNSSGNTENSVGENGDVAYWNLSHDVLRFRGGSNTNITSDNGVNWLNVYPLTDGTNIVFLRRPTGVYDGAEIWLFDGTALSMLAPFRSIQVLPHSDYEVNGGWTAFTKADASGFAQVWTRSPSGVLRAVSAFATSSRIRALGTDGSVVFDTDVDRYFASATGSPTRISASNGSVVWRSGHFIMMLGNAAFTVSP
ncbi:MAG: hypothetical protein DMD30_08230 [Gemmatimonadetes bacterium]|nr:MAG: hypothetical protein DMD30_08230 [Gemmatimonadota bacterium]